MFSEIYQIYTVLSIFFLSVCDRSALLHFYCQVLASYWFFNLLCSACIMNNSRITHHCLGGRKTNKCNDVTGLHIWRSRHHVLSHNSQTCQEILMEQSAVISIAADVDRFLRPPNVIDADRDVEAAWMFWGGVFSVKYWKNINSRWPLPQLSTL